MILELPIDEINYAFKNPIGGCRDPWKGAHGRVAEDRIIRWAVATTKSTWTVEPEASSLPWPEHVASIITANRQFRSGRYFNYAFDGVLGQYIAEVKLETDGPVELAASQYTLRNACAKAGIPYLLILGTLTKETTHTTPGEAKPIGIVDLCVDGFLEKNRVLVSKVREASVNTAWQLFSETLKAK